MHDPQHTLLRRPANAALHAALLVFVATSCATAEKRAPPQGPSHPEPAASAPASEAPDRTGTDLEHEVPAEPRPDGRNRADADGRALPDETAGAVRDAVRSAAIARSRPAHGTAHALRAIAGMLERVAGRIPQADASIGRMLVEIETLERLAAIDLERADRVEAALEEGVEAMNAIARRPQLQWLHAWVEAAAAAVSAIDPETPFGLQRAPVQDALRSFADAVIVAAGYFEN